MNDNYFNAEVSSRICSHMNDDHREALLGYAHFYGGVAQPLNAEMIEINPKSMKLLVDGEILEILFDHTLQDRNDAHKTLVAMIKKFSNNI